MGYLIAFIQPKNNYFHCFEVQTASPLGHQLSVFNSQSTIQIGGKWNSLLSRVERPFAGVLAGLVYNNMRPLDQAKDRAKGTSTQGHVTVLDHIPFDWRDLHPVLFEQVLFFAFTFFLVTYLAWKSILTNHFLDFIVI